VETIEEKEKFDFDFSQFEQKALPGDQDPDVEPFEEEEKKEEEVEVKEEKKKPEYDSEIMKNLVQQRFVLTFDSLNLIIGKFNPQLTFLAEKVTESLMTSQNIEEMLSSHCMDIAHIDLIKCSLQNLGVMIEIKRNELQIQVGINRIYAKVK
jgi:hypothetical protein